MKIRIFSTMDDAVYRITIHTEDWSQGDLELMEQFGEPEVDVGGEIDYDSGDVALEKSFSGVKAFGHEYLRVLHGFPYSRGFDSRDYGSVNEAVAIGRAWKDLVTGRISDEVIGLRSMSNPLPTEEIDEI